MSEETPRWDVLVVPGRPSFRIAERGLKSLLDYCGASQLMVPRERLTGDGWVEVYLAPDRYAHHIFAEGDAPAAAPVFREAVVRYGAAPTALAYGDRGRDVCVYLELIGAIYEDIGERFRARLHQLLYLHPQSFSRPHLYLPRPAGEVAGPRERMARRAAVSVEEADDLL